MPELLGENIDVFLNASGLRRQEIEFTREEFGGGIGARKYFRPISSDVSVRYNYQVLHAAETDLELTDLAQSAGVGALVTDLKHDRRDNPLYPRQGYKIFSTLELASELLGGEVNYERLEIAVSWHRPLDEGRWIHFGLGHGMVLTSGDSSTELPFNRRFFPGGENSIRGYQQGEAAPRDDRGRIVGAETYLSGNFEFEQSLTSAWSVIAFFDALGIGLEARDLPTDEGLFSVGAGLRWKTIVGPVRLEYGHNLNPRKHDPSGTLHFSIGFPF
jgi:outer membrane translocation and assembly module TamA